MRRINLLLLFLGLIAITLSCQKKSEYHKLVEKELASGLRHDSLFFGIYLGMSSRDFYAHCWKLNKQGLIRQGAGNTSVYHQIKDFDYPAGMDFYPTFYEGKIVEMPLIFAYDGWAPWNKHLHAKHLKVEVLALMKKWYGPDFIEVKKPGPFGGNAFVKVDGNRRISIYEMDDSRVMVNFVDLLAQREKK